VARAKEMLRRTQEALHQAQADNADAAARQGRRRAEAAGRAKQVDAAQSGSKAAQAALNAKLTSAQSAQADLQKQAQ
jgi:hypothetical protein